MAAASTKIATGRLGGLPKVFTKVPKGSLLGKESTLGIFEHLRRRSASSKVLTYNLYYIRRCSKTPNMIPFGKRWAAWAMELIVGCNEVTRTKIAIAEIEA